LSRKEAFDERHRQLEGRSGWPLLFEGEKRGVNTRRKGGKRGGADWHSRGRGKGWIVISRFSREEGKERGGISQHIVVGRKKTTPQLNKNGTLTRFFGRDPGKKKERVARRGFDEGLQLKEKEPQI